MTINYFLLVSGENIIGAGSQPSTQLQPEDSAPDLVTGEITTTNVEVPLPLPENCIPCTQAQHDAWQTLEIVGGVLQTVPVTNVVAREKQNQKALIKEAFTLAANAPITDANGITWEGSKESGTSIFLGCQLAQQAGATMITVFDAAKEPHQMTIAEGMAVAALIGMQYQTVLAKKNALYAQIDVAKTVDDVQTVMWE